MFVGIAEKVLKFYSDKLTCLAKPSCYTWPACRYLLCCPAWQLVDRV